MKGWKLVTAASDHPDAIARRHTDRILNDFHGAFTAHSLDVAGDDFVDWKQSCLGGDFDSLVRGMEAVERPQGSTGTLNANRFI